MPTSCGPSGRQAGRPRSVSRAAARLQDPAARETRSVPGPPRDLSGVVVGLVEDRRGRNEPDHVARPACSSGVARRPTVCRSSRTSMSAGSGPRGRWGHGRDVGIVGSQPRGCVFLGRGRGRLARARPGRGRVASALRLSPYAARGALRATGAGRGRVGRAAGAAGPASRSMRTSAGPWCLLQLGLFVGLCLLAHDHPERRWSPTPARPRLTQAVCQSSEPGPAALPNVDPPARLAGVARAKHRPPVVPELPRRGP